MPLRMWSGLLITGAAIIFVLLFNANAGHNSDQYGRLGKYLVFNDSWGTNRGYVWRKSLELFQNFPIQHKIFGYGLETFGILTTQNFLADMIKATQGQVFDNAHNEYLQYLVTTGALGLITYVIFLVVAGWNMVMRKKENIYIIGCLFAVLSYSAQALVNLNLPITAPLMWLMLSVGIAAGKQKSSYSCN